MRHILLTIGLVWGLIISIFFIACEIPYYTVPVLNNLASTPESSRDRDRDDDDDDDRPETCYDRDSCQDICDLIFSSSSARRECYDLDIDDVNNHQEVFDELAERQIDRRGLNSIDEDLFQEYIEISPNSWDDIIRGDGSRDAYTKEEALIALTWIIENEEIANALLDEDTDLEILYSLLVRYAKGHNLQSIQPFRPDPTTTITWEADELTISKTDSSQSVNIDAIDETLDFIVAFIGIYRSDNTKSSSYGNSSNNQSFVHFAEREADNPDAVFELAHETLRKFCMEATSEDERDDEDVLKCMMAMYCSIQTTTNDVEDNWRFLEDSPFGLNRDTNEMCTYEFLTDNDDLERVI